MSNEKELKETMNTGFGKITEALEGLKSFFKKDDKPTSEAATETTTVVEQPAQSPGYSKEEVDAKFAEINSNFTTGIEKLIETLTETNKQTVEAVEKFAAQHEPPATDPAGRTGTEGETAPAYEGAAYIKALRNN